MKFGKFAAALVAGTVALASQAAFAGDQDFTLVNHTGCVITKVLVAPHSETSWGEDIMGRDVLGDDESVDIKFACEETTKHWDLKVIDKDGHEIVWENLNLTKISKLTLKFEDHQPTAIVE